MRKRASHEALTCASKSYLATRFLELQQLRKGVQREEQIKANFRPLAVCDGRKAIPDRSAVWPESLTV